MSVKPRTTGRWTYIGGCARVRPRICAIAGREADRAAAAAVAAEGVASVGESNGGTDVGLLAATQSEAAAMARQPYRARVSNQRREAASGEERSRSVAAPVCGGPAGGGRSEEHIGAAAMAQIAGCLGLLLRHNEDLEDPVAARGPPAGPRHVRPYVHVVCARVPVSEVAGGPWVLDGVVRRAANGFNVRVGEGLGIHPE